MTSIESVHKSLTDIRKLGRENVEYWMARDIQQALGYQRWREFRAVIEKARMSCESMGGEPDNHFVPTYKMVGIGSETKRKVEDLFVSRYGAYLIAMNGNPKLEQIAIAQSYFAVQTRKQELLDGATDIQKRIVLRDRVKDANKHLGKAAQDAGVQKWGLFQDAGYQGLYGLRLSQVKEKKGLDSKEELLDRAGRAELAANEFRITQTEEALRRDKVQGDEAARNTHRRVASKVRDTIEELGGTMPEDHPAEPSIRKLVAEKTGEKQIEKK